MELFDFMGTVFDESQQCLFVFLPAIDDAVLIVFCAKYKSLNLTQKKKIQKKGKRKETDPHIPLLTLMVE